MQAPLKAPTGGGYLYRGFPADTLNQLACFWPRSFCVARRTLCGLQFGRGLASLVSWLPGVWDRLQLLCREVAYLTAWLARFPRW